MSNSKGDITSFFKKVKNLHEFADIKFKTFKKMIDLKEYFKVFSLSLVNSELVLDNGNKKITEYKTIQNELKERFENKVGLYGFQIEKENQRSFIYIGKSKKLHYRLSQHLTGKNIDGSEIAKSTHHKYDALLDLARDKEIEIKMFIWSNKSQANRSTVDYELGVLEALIIGNAKKDFDKMMKSLDMDKKHWNIRVG